MNKFDFLNPDKCPFCHSTQLEELGNNKKCIKCNSVSRLSGDDLQLISKPSLENNIIRISTITFSITGITGFVALFGLKYVLIGKISLSITLISISIAFLFNAIQAFKYGIIKSFKTTELTYFEDNPITFIFIQILHLILIPLSFWVSYLLVNDTVVMILTKGIS